ncbi:MAG: 4Fe-4S binding protein [Clostridiales bacterium]|nr:4Fe-4S binding protein [Clostridiales bacterium]
MLLSENCVACGVCVPICPKSAMRIDKGISAAVYALKCVGFGKRDPRRD